MCSYMGCIRRQTGCDRSSASSTTPGNGQGSDAMARPPGRNRSFRSVPEPGELIAGVQRTLRAIVSATVGESMPPTLSKAAGVRGVPAATLGEALVRAGRARLAGV